MKQVLTFKIGSFLRRIDDDAAYIAPMAIFILLTYLASVAPSLYVGLYVAKTFLAAIVLWLLWQHYTRISWRYSELGLVMGVIGVVQWVGMEKLILHAWPHYLRPPHDIFDPGEHFQSRLAETLFALVRIGGAALVVPIMEELFWRDFLWRSFIAPRDFKLASIGEWSAKSFVLVALFFGVGEHVQWITAIAWGMMIGWLLLYTRSLGACIIMHGVTNLLLGVYVLWTHDWQFW